MANTRQRRLIASELVTILRSENLKKKNAEMSQLIVSEPTTVSV